jgi:hypothetical protein
MAKSKAKITYRVGCQIHGSPSKATNQFKDVKVPVPLNKRERLHGGCPFCKSGAPAS